MNINVSESDGRGGPTVFPDSVSNLTTTVRSTHSLFICSQYSITIYDSQIIGETFTSNVAIRTRTTLRVPVPSVSWLHLARPPISPDSRRPPNPSKSAHLTLVIGTSNTEQQAIDSPSWLIAPGFRSRSALPVWRKPQLQQGSD